MLVRVDFLKRLGQAEIDIVEAHLPLLDPGSDPNAVITLLLSLRFCVLLGGITDLAGEGSGLFQGLIVIDLRLGNSPR
jgi:hypothetical protein